jgi:hypothetical protein
MKFLSLLALICLFFACAPTKETFKDELAYSQNKHNLAYDYRNDSLDFAFPYYGLTNFDIHPTKKTIDTSFLPKQWVKMIRKDALELLYFAKRASSKEANMAFVYPKNTNLDEFIHNKIEVINKNLNTTAIYQSKDKSIQYGFTVKNQPFQVVEYYRAYKKYYCRFIFIRAFDKNESLLANALPIREYMEDSLKQRVYRQGNMGGAYRLMGATFPFFQYNYLSPFFWLAKFKKDNPYATVDKSLEMQAVRTYQSFMGAYKQTLSYPETFRQYNWPITDSEKADFLSFSPENAVQRILKKSANRQIIMLNEDHLSSRTRLLGKQLLKGLYEQGVRYLSMETLDKGQDSIANVLRRPYQEMGYYTSDPMFGNFVREALDLGYTLVAHENTEPCEGDMTARENCRDENQAKNIAKVFKKDPKARVFVYVGHGHIVKKFEGQPNKFLGEQLQLVLGINPFTIEQTVMCETDSTKYEHPYYRLVQEKYHPKESIVLTKGDSTWVDSAMGYTADIQVFHPRTEYTDGHPTWMLNQGDIRYNVVLKDKKYDGKLLQVFKEDEVGDSKHLPIPMLNLPLKANNEFPIYLPAGKYQLVVTDYLSKSWYFQRITLPSK